MSKNNTQVSVIVATKNEENNLPRLCESLFSQTFTSWELVIIDNYSTDNTPEIAKEYTEKFYQIGPERSVQRNFGATQSDGQYLLFLDADMVLHSAVLEECVKTVKSEEFDALIIPEYSYGEGFWAACIALEKQCYIGDEAIEAPRFIRFKAFQLIGGFDENMISGEDWDLREKIKQKGLKIGRITACINHYEGNPTFISLIRKKLYYAIHSDAYLEKNVTNLTSTLGFLVRKAYLKNFRLFVKDPIHGFGLFILKSAQFAAAGLGALIYKKKYLKSLVKLKK